MINFIHSVNTVETNGVTIQVCICLEQEQVLLEVSVNESVE